MKATANLTKAQIVAYYQALARRDKAVHERAVEGPMPPP